MNFKKYLSIITLLIALYGVDAKAQVNVGADLAPASGALLQIKDIEAADADPSNTTTKTGGFILPRVALTNINSLNPFPVTGSKDHTGLLVYNITDQTPFQPGIYVWNESKWVLVVSTTDPKQIEQK